MVGLPSAPRLAPLAAMACLLTGNAWAREPLLRSLVVPDELSAVTANPEPSGIVWSPSLRRYLVVSDDMGLRSHDTYHAPWLLGLGENGIFDKAPIIIDGAKTIDDAESICAGPDGTYFLVTSHSPNRRNRISAARRQLMLLTEDSGKLVLLARTDLTKVAGGVGSLLATATPPPEGPLDIEAVTYHAGALFIGLKSPLATGGEAAIVRIADPMRMLREGRAGDNAIELFALVPLCVSVARHRVCQGIADMTFLPDGSLMVAANAPKGGPSDHGGALWQLPLPVGRKPAILLHRFPGLKPEGVTLSPTSRSLIIVFDRDDRPGQWTEVPLTPSVQP
jgi:hypothetical protein